MKFFAFADTETTGLDRGSRMVSLAGIVVDAETGQELDRREWTINPGMPIPPDVTPINGFTDAAVKNAPGADVVLREFFDWIPAGAVLVAHYAQYDTGIISWDAARVGVPIPEGLTVIDTCEIAKATKATKKNTLDALVEHYGIQRCGQGHRAMSDADACMEYFMRVRELQPLSPLPWAHAGHDYGYTDQFPEHLAGLPALVAAGTPLTFAYEDKDGAQTKRTVTPYGWHELKGELYFSGLCALRKERRTFKADRVVTVLEAAA